MLLLLRCTNSILSPAILETVYHFFSGFPSNDQSQEDAAIARQYDFIVIGAGAAGSVLANRLTENRDWNVLVLEQGEDEIFLTDIPFMAPILYTTDYVRMFKSESGPQDANGYGGYCLSMTNGRCNIASGRAIGGSSVVNFMIYSRGAPSDYDGWQASENPGWSYADVLPYFIKSERCRLIDKDTRYAIK